MGHWSASVQALVRVSGGIEKGQWGLVRVNGIGQGIEKGQWRRWSGSMGALGSMGVGQGQCRYGMMGAQWRY